MTPRERAIQCINDEAAALSNLALKVDEQFDVAVKLILKCRGKVIVTGVGKSGHIGAKIAATLSSTGTPAFYINPLDVFHGDLGVMTPDDVVIAISNSGQTDELLRFIPMLMHWNIPIIAMTGHSDSLLAKYSKCHLNVGVDHEACPLDLAPTSSTTAALAMGDALAVALMHARNFKPQDFARLHPGGELGKKLLMTAEDIMHTTNLPLLDPDMSLGKAIIVVSQARLGLGVAIEDGKIAGLITDGDIRRAIDKWQANFFGKTVRDIMTKSPKTVTPETKITDIQMLMHVHTIHAVLVADKDNKLLGVVDHHSCLI